MFRSVGDWSGCVLIFVLKTPGEVFWFLDFGQIIILNLILVLYLSFHHYLFIVHEHKIYDTDKYCPIICALFIDRCSMAMMGLRI